MDQPLLCTTAAISSDATQTDDTLTVDGDTYPATRLNVLGAIATAAPIGDVYIAHVRINNGTRSPLRPLQP